MSKPKVAAPLDPALVTRWVPLETLVPDPNNSNMHDERNISTIVRSFKRFGQRYAMPVQVDTNVVLKGNGALVAMKQIAEQYATEPGIADAEHWHPSIVKQAAERVLAVCDAPLAGPDAIAFGIVDNQSGRLSDFDYAVLGAQLKSLVDVGYDVTLTGFTDYEVKPLVDAARRFARRFHERAVVRRARRVPAALGTSAGGVVDGVRRACRTAHFEGSDAMAARVMTKRQKARAAKSARDRRKRLAGRQKDLGAVFKALDGVAVAVKKGSKWTPTLRKQYERGAAAGKRLVEALRIA